MEVIIAFFGAWLFTWPALLILAVLGLLFEANQGHKMAAFIGIVMATVAYFTFHIPIMYLVYGVVAYLVVGFAWSFYRYKRHADKVVEVNMKEDQRTRERAITDLHPTKMLGTITSWVLIWPFSFIENIAGDLISALQSMITKFFRGIYHRIFDSASAKLLGGK